VQTGPSSSSSSVCRSSYKLCLSSMRFLVPVADKFTGRILFSLVATISLSPGRPRPADDSHHPLSKEFFCNSKSSKLVHWLKSGMVPENLFL
jgi:hypothetical protein